MRLLARRAVLAGLAVQMLFPALAAQGVPNRQPERPPDRTAADFYRWYLRELAAKHSPLGGRNAETSKVLRSYVSLPLLREIERKMHSEDGLDADPFLQAQDYLNDWLKNVATSETKVGMGVASTVVTLGERPESKYRLSVGLVEDAGMWKIRKVERVRAVPEPRR